MSEQSEATNVMLRGLTPVEYDALKDLAKANGRSIGKEAMMAVRRMLEERNFSDRR